MNKSNVLVATDFSDDAALALNQARAYARMTGAGLLIVHVMQGPTPGEGEGMLHEGAYADQSASLAQQLKELAETVDDVPCQYQLLRGTPAAAILQLASEVPTSMIVLGTHGRSGMARVLMGSVAETVIRRATCPVMIVKQPRSIAEATAT